MMRRAGCGPFALRPEPKGLTVIEFIKPFAALRANERLVRSGRG